MGGEMHTWKDQEEIYTGINNEISPADCCKAYRSDFGYLDVGSVHRRCQDLEQYVAYQKVKDPSTGR
jgi:hypothetical protein